jgi:hypothetical protein
MVDFIDPTTEHTEGAQINNLDFTAGLMRNLARPFYFEVTTQDPGR